MYYLEAENVLTLGVNFYRQWSRHAFKSYTLGFEILTLGMFFWNGCLYGSRFKCKLVFFRTLNFES